MAPINHALTTDGYDIARMATPPGAPFKSGPGVFVDMTVDAISRARSTTRSPCMSGRTGIWDLVVCQALRRRNREERTRLHDRHGR